MATRTSVHPGFSRWSRSATHTRLRRVTSLGTMRTVAVPLPDASTSICAIATERDSQSVTGSDRSTLKHATLPSVIARSAERATTLGARHRTLILLSTHPLIGKADGEHHAEGFSLGRTPRSTATWIHWPKSGADPRFRVIATNAAAFAPKSVVTPIETCMISQLLRPLWYPEKSPGMSVANHN